MTDNLEVTVARLDERVSDIEEWRVKLNGNIEGIRKELQQIREDWGRRPTWGLSLAVTCLASALATLATYIITH